MGHFGIVERTNYSFVTLLIIEKGMVKHNHV